jgi:hypothetical protein
MGVGSGRERLMYHERADQAETRQSVAAQHDHQHREGNWTKPEMIIGLPVLSGAITIPTTPY